MHVARVQQLHSNNNNNNKTWRGVLSEFNNTVVECTVVECSGVYSSNCTTFC